MKKIGIIGAGNIGLTLANLLLEHNIVDKEHLFISYKGNPQTRQRLDDNNLTSSIVSNEKLIAEASIIFLTIKPKDYNFFREENKIDKISNTTILISTVAGYPLSQMKDELQFDNIYNMMPSGPETLLDQKGICALYPANSFIQNLMESLQVNVFAVTSEKAFYVFTTALCLPAAFLQLNAYPCEEDASAFIINYSKWIPQFAAVYQWAKNVTPLNLNEEDKNRIIKNMSTEGGVTENLVHHIIEGNKFFDAFSKAVDYCEYLAKK